MQGVCAHAVTMSQQINSTTPWLAITGRGLKTNACASMAMQTVITHSRVQEQMLFSKGCPVNMLIQGGAPIMEHCQLTGISTLCCTMCNVCGCVHHCTCVMHRVLSGVKGLPGCKKMKGEPGLSTLWTSPRNRGKSAIVCRLCRQTTASTLLLACSTTYLITPHTTSQQVARLLWSTQSTAYDCAT